MHKIGIIGAGMMGSTTARLFVDAGHEVAVSNSRGPASLEAITRCSPCATRALAQREP